MPKFCKDCKYYRRDWYEHIINKTSECDICARPDNKNFINGKSKLHSCLEERTYSFLCGPEGRYWEAK